MATSEAPGSGSALVAPENGVEHTHAKAGGGRSTHTHPKADEGHGHSTKDDQNDTGVALLPLPKSAGEIEGKPVKYFQADFAIKSVTQKESGTLVLEGYANTWDLDRDGEETAKSAFDDTLGDYMANAQLLWQHKEGHVIGEVVEATTDDKGLHIVAEVPPPPAGTEAWHVKVYNDIKRGLLKAFSMGGVFFRSKSIDGLIERVKLFEVSVVSVPANQSSLFNVARTKGMHFEGYTGDQNGSDASVLADHNTKELPAQTWQEGTNMPEMEGKSITVDAKQFEEMTKTLNGLAEEKRARDLETQAEEKAMKLIESEKKAAEDAAKRDVEDQKRMDALVANAVERLRPGVTSGKKFSLAQSDDPTQPYAGGGTKAITTVPAGEKREGGYKNLRGWLKDIRDSKRGNPTAWKRLEDLHVKAAEFYATDDEGDIDTKALAEGTSTAGGFLVPPQYWQQGIAEYRLAAAKIAPLMTNMPVNSNLVYIPRETGVPVAGWTAENAAKPSQDSTFGQLAVNIFALAGIAKVSNQMLDDSSPGIEGIVRKDLGRVLAQAEDVAEINGTGVGQPTGVLNTTGVLTVAYTAPGSGSGLLDGISTAIGAIDQNFFDLPTAIVSPPRMITKLRNVKDTTGRPILEPAYAPALAATGPGSNLGAMLGAGAGSLPGAYGNPVGRGSLVGTIWGIPVISDANIPTNLGGGTNESPIILGVWSEAYRLERMGVTLDVSSEAGSSFEQNQTWFRGETRIGATFARQPTAFAYISGLTNAIAG